MSELIMANFLVMVLMMAIQTFFYLKLSVKSMIRFPIMLTTTSFSLIITPLLMRGSLPTTPYIQLFFMVYQTFLFFFSTIEYLKIKKNRLM